MKSCNDTCKKYQAKGRAPNKGRYRNGQKRCQYCEIYIIWDGRWCPCCVNRLRTKPRNRKNKEQYEEVMAN